MFLWVSPLNQILQLHTYSATEPTIANARMHASDNLINRACQCAQSEGDTENLRLANKSAEDVYWNTSSYAVVRQSYNPKISLKCFNSIALQLQPPIHGPLWNMFIGCCIAFILDELVMMIIRVILTLHTCQLDARLNKIVRTSCINNPCWQFLLRIALLGLCIYAMQQRSSQCWNSAFSLPEPKPFRKVKKENAECLEIPGAVFVKSSAPAKKVRTHSIIGDGNCFWTALAHELPCTIVSPNKIKYYSKGKAELFARKRRVSNEISSRTCAQGIPAN